MSAHSVVVPYSRNGLDNEATHNRRQTGIPENTEGDIGQYATELSRLVQELMDSTYRLHTATLNAVTRHNVPAVNNDFRAIRESFKIEWGVFYKLIRGYANYGGKDIAFLGELLSEGNLDSEMTQEILESAPDLLSKTKSLNIDHQKVIELWNGYKMTIQRTLPKRVPHRAQRTCDFQPYNPALPKASTQAYVDAAVDASYPDGSIEVERLSTALEDLCKCFDHLEFFWEHQVKQVSAATGIKSGPNLTTAMLQAVEKWKGYVPLISAAASSIQASSDALVEAIKPKYSSPPSTIPSASYYSPTAWFGSAVEHLAAIPSAVASMMPGALNEDRCQENKRQSPDPQGLRGDNFVYESYSSKGRTGAHDGSNSNSSL